MHPHKHSHTHLGSIERLDFAGLHHLDELGLGVRHVDLLVEPALVGLREAGRALFGFMQVRPQPLKRGNDEHLSAARLVPIFPYPLQCTVFLRSGEARGVGR